MSELLHQVENNEDSQQHLDSHKEKFLSDCRIALRELYTGQRITGKYLKDKYGEADWTRRLREVFLARKDVKRDWVRTADGKTTNYKEFWMEIPMQPTKQECLDWAHNYLEAMKSKGTSQANLFG